MRVPALSKGGWAERIGAAIILANTLAYVVNETRFHSPIASLVIDALTALAFLGVALRYASFWQGAVMLLYAMQFGLHAYYFVLERPVRDTLLHAVVNNTIFFAILACLTSGMAARWPVCAGARIRARRLLTRRRTPDCARCAIAPPYRPHQKSLSCTAAGTLAFGPRATPSQRGAVHL